MAFRDYLQQDIDKVFFNIHELAEVHNVGGRELPVVVDYEKVEKLSQNDYDGIFIGAVAFSVKASDFGAKPKPEMLLAFDSVLYKVFDATGSDVYDIILKASES